MKLSFPIKQIESEFVLPYRNRTEPPICVIPQEYDIKVDSGGLITLMHSADGHYFLGSDRAYGGRTEPPTVQSIECRPNKFNQPVFCNDIEFFELEAYYDVGKSEGRECITIFWNPEEETAQEVLTLEDVRRMFGIDGP